ncbi:MAG TPA: MFS transporter [Myxococcota bacterium]|nr:MFS transporter [Myxococcota bacterium]HRY94927.1 MFS transporter [Myxococcota bacterium]HSA22634.1 MFS transporter [Myxococcota bacterium]
MLPDEPLWRLQLKQTFAALGHRNYRLWFMGQLVSLLGTWMQGTAQAYLVFELTHSRAYLGYVAFAAGIPSWLFMLYGGVVADRVSRRKLLLVTQACMLALAAVLAVLAFTGVVQAWHILCLAFALGVVNAFDAPARHAFAAELVPREDLTNAIALNSTMFNTATAVGPAVAGLTYDWFGPGWCFAINSVSFVGVIVALALIHLPPSPPRPPAGPAGRELAEGLRFAAGHAEIRLLLGLIVALSLFGLAFATLIPAWAVNVLGGGAATSGFLQSARGSGALIGALLVASLGRIRFHGRLLTWATFAFPVALLVFSAVRQQALALSVLVLAGGAMIVCFNLCNALVQTLAPDALRGRVMGIYSLAFFGFVPVGGLLAGSLAERLGEPLTVVLGASVFLAFALGVRLLQPRLSRLQ